ncbi:hypothetical protein OZX74_01345 [Bifidobacterium sp. ESL0798]|uniref:hypothetical protein n=1 Tax=Bifidobacterium sp. ESL0798 TaxID=2983235 RepID=UPI0023F94592|nr:hypothetical protein [Bifidobacterium sp. ESL0798]WEV74238.1 hypothetical protein OZX74_01345 [Bifidobacterium sp. ESL0798]
MTASKAKIEPGGTSIDRAKMRKENGSYVFDWRIRLMDGRLLTRRSRGKTIGIARRRARESAAELLRSGGQKTWKTTDLMNDYISEVSIPAIESSNLRKNTKLRYTAAARQLLIAYKTDQNTEGYTIAGGTTFKTLETVLRSIAQEHGKESAHHARTVLSKYVLQSMVRDGLVENNLLLKESIDLNLPEDEDDRAITRGGHALTLTQYTSVVQTLLTNGARRRYQQTQTREIRAGRPCCQETEHNRPYAFAGGNRSESRRGERDYMAGHQFRT